MPIVFPDAVLMQKIKPKNTFFDKKSLEAGTGRTKEKYKVAGNTIDALGVYPFFVTTSHEETCDHMTTVKVEQGDWEQREAGYLEGTSFVDLKKCVAHTKAELLSMMRDAGNGLKFVARLPDSKHVELTSLIPRIPTRYASMTLNTQRLVVQALTATNYVDETLRKLNLL